MLTSSPSQSHSPVDPPRVDHDRYGDQRDCQGVDAETGDGTVEEGEEAPAEDEGGEESPAPPAAGSAQERLDQALTDMDTAVADAETAMADGNWTAYGEAQERMADALERAIAANQELDGTGVRVTLIEPGAVDTPFFDSPLRIRALEADDIARAVMYAVSQPPHVDVNEMLIRPTAQDS